MENIHSLLKRQMKKHLGESFSLPNEFKDIFNAVNNAYIQSDVDRNMLERSLDLSSQELLLTNDELKNTLSLLRESEGKYRSLYQEFLGILDAIPDALVLLSSDLKVVWSNEVAAKNMNMSLDDFIGQHCYKVRHERSEPCEICPVLECFTSHKPKIIESTTPDGRTWELHVYPVFGDRGEVKGVIEAAHNITERKRGEQEKRKLEEQLFNSQKMEAIGTLAGGIAHDFNNLLTGILGYTCMMLMKTEKSNPFYEKLKIIEQQVLSGSELTKQLLGFARGGRYDVRPVNVNDLIIKTSEIFGRTKKEITIHKKLQEDLYTIEADSGQIEQVLLNLYVNAWQAMPAGGELYLESSNVVLDEQESRTCNAEAGRYVKISVTDTGVGMDSDTQKRIFEPFFTTKGVGKGTGLGLASAYGIIRNHGGIINVYSEKGHGTTFTVSLPASGAKAAEPKPAEEVLLTGEETILVVDDEKVNVEMIKELLEQLGYKILMAQSGKEAVVIYSEHSGEIRLVILDMIMPEMSGKETLIKLMEIDKKIRVLLSSGYSINGEARKILDMGCKGFIQKPFRIEELSEKIRGVLDRGNS